MVQRASTDSSTNDKSLEESPTIMKRLADDKGWIMTGFFDTDGKPTADRARRSPTSCLARLMSVPGSKYRKMEDNPGNDFDSILSSQGTPASIFCSRETVTISSTSLAESPRASV